MIKQIRTDQFKPGMYIHDLNCGWLDHPFVPDTFQVRDQATVGKIYHAAPQHDVPPEIADLARAPDRIASF